MPRQSRSRAARFFILTIMLGGMLASVASAQSGPPVTPEIVAAAAAAKTPVAPGPVQPTWDSIRANYTVPQWYVDAKFGITMHWGLFSVAAYHNEWYEKYLYSTFSQWHTQNFGPPDQFGYKDFIPMFQAKDFNADDLAALVKESGAKYFAPTVEHHDGFSLWNSQVNPFNASNMGPRRDLVGEMAVATRKVGLKFGVASHNMEHYTFIRPTPGLKTDLDDPKYANFYWTDHSDARLTEFLEDWVLKSMELIDKYQPDVFWYDNGINSRDYNPLKLKVAAYYYNRALGWHKQVTLMTKDSAFLAGSVLEFEKLNPRGPTQILQGVWDAEEPIGSTWGYSAANPVETFRGAGSVINELCTIVSMNGNLLLNLSPTGQGAINEQQRTALKEIGKWLAVNGEAIYGTHSWIVDGEGFTPLPPRGAAARRPGAAAAAGAEEGPTAVAAPIPSPPAVAALTPADSQSPRPVVYRFTAKGDDLYAIAQSWPGESAVIASLAKGKLLDGKTVEGKIKTVTLLGSPGNLKFTQDAESLKVTLPADKPCDFAFSLKITGLKMNPAGPPVPAVMADLR
ncbi:MAG: alpha-L-fucosidase [Acidobacteriaceae bacterium]|jgi:alpha-L-fucosidase